MTRKITTITVVMLVTALLAAPVAAASVPGTLGAATVDETATPTPNENASVAPGERLSGVVAVQQAEFDGELAERTFGVKVAQANSNDSKAAVVAEQLGDVEGRLQELEQRKQELTEAHENGSISDGEFRAKMADLATRTENAKRLVNASGEVADGLPAELLESNGINVSAIQTLKDRAEELTGPEVAEIARSIAGENAGKSIAGNQGKPGALPEQANGSDAGEDNQPGDAGEQGDDAAGDNGTDAAGDNAGSEDESDDEETETATSDGQDGDRGGDSGQGGDAGAP